MITVEVDASQAFVKLDRMPNQLRAALRGAIIDLTKSLSALVRQKLSGQVLNVRSGRLRDSIQTQLVENTSTLYGVVFSKGVPYAAIHEYGGTINHPGSSKFQAWEGPAGWVFTRFTRPHAIPMPERSYMRSSLNDMRSEIVQRLTAAAQQGVKAA